MFVIGAFLIGWGFWVTVLWHIYIARADFWRANAYLANRKLIEADTHGALIDALVISAIVVAMMLAIGVVWHRRGLAAACRLTLGCGIAGFAPFVCSWFLQPTGLDGPQLENCSALNHAVYGAPGGGEGSGWATRRWSPTHLGMVVVVRPAHEQPRTVICR